MSETDSRPVPNPATRKFTYADTCRLTACRRKGLSLKESADEMGEPLDFVERIYLAGLQRPGIRNSMRVNTEAYITRHPGMRRS